MNNNISYCKWCDAQLDEEIPDEKQICCGMRMVLMNFTGEFCTFTELEGMIQNKGEKDD